MKTTQSNLVVLLTIALTFLTTTLISAQGSTAKWTYLVYLMGSDLESHGGAGSSDLKEMMQIGSNANVNVVVTTGGANKDDAAQGGVNWRKINRWKIEKGKMTNIPYTASSHDMAAPDNLTDFIVWGQKTYPAEKYVLVLWDHGGAIDGYGHDENSQKMLSIMQIKGALAKALAVTAKPFELLGFDACLMANLEALNNFKSFSK